LDEAFAYRGRHKQEIGAIVISGRWSDSTTVIGQTEADVAKQYLLSKNPELPVLTEEFAVETGGNFAFSKPIIAEQNSECVVVFNSIVYAARVRYFAHKIFDPSWHMDYVLIEDEFSKNERAIQKEPKALEMFRSLLDGLQEGDDAGAREILLTQTPFYDRTAVDNEAFFNERWPGGFEDFIGKRRSIDNR
jgi:hypothetical protein